MHTAPQKEQRRHFSQEPRQSLRDATFFFLLQAKTKHKPAQRLLISSSNVGL